MMYLFLDIEQTKKDLLNGYKLLDGINMKRKKEQKSWLLVLSAHSIEQ